LSHGIHQPIVCRHPLDCRTKRVCIGEWNLEARFPMLDKFSESTGIGRNDWSAAGKRLNRYSAKRLIPDGWDEAETSFLQMLKSCGRLAKPGKLDPHICAPVGGQAMQRGPVRAVTDDQQPGTMPPKRLLPRVDKPCAALFDGEP